MKISDKSFALNFYFELPGTLDWGRFNKTYLLEEKRKDPIHKPIILKMYICQLQLGFLIESLVYPVSH